jgi:hypothetical protein
MIADFVPSVASFGAKTGYFLALWGNDAMPLMAFGQVYFA